jgi:hypothetical protein
MLTPSLGAGATQAARENEEFNNLYLNRDYYSVMHKYKG